MPQTTTATSAAHVVVLAFPFSTHAAPLLTIIRRLAISTPTTHFSFFNTAKSNNSIFSTSKHYELPNVKAYDVWDGVPEGYVFVGKHQEDIELFMKAAPESFRASVEAAVAETRKKVSCLVTDAFFWFAGEIAEEMSVPWVPFWTAGPNSLSAHVHTDLIRETVGVGGIAGREDENLKLIQGMSKIRIKDLPEGILFGDLESLFSKMLHQMGLNLPKAAAVFINSFEGLDLTITNDLKSKFKRFLNVGPLNLTLPPSPTLDTHGCLPWLDHQKPASVAYISFGSVVTPPPHELVAIAEALEASEVPFIWSLKDNSKEHLPNGFLENTKTQGIVVSWAPQLEVLGHGSVGVFVTHCGWNSLLESIAEGVPLICRPFFGDQRLNGRLVEVVLEIGLSVESGVFTKKGLVSCFNLILSQENGKKLRGRIRVLKNLAQEAVGPRGSSTENFKVLLEIVSKR